MRTTRTTNPQLMNLIRTLRKQSRENEARVWRDLADRLARSRRRRTTVNVSRLNRYTQEGETVAVPGKVLGTGSIDHPLRIAAFSFSKQAESKILSSKGECFSIRELIEKNPKGTHVRILE